MNKVLRYVLGFAIVGVVLYAADLATRDCRVAPYVYEDCLWLTLRTHLGLPASRLLRMSILEGVGISLALVLYFTFRYVFPFRRKASHGTDSAPQSEPSIDPHTV